MFLEFFKKEVFTALKRPMIYIFMFIVGFLVFGAVVSDNIVIGGVVGDVKKNAPSVVVTFVCILNIFGLLFATAFFNNAALRDHQYGFHEILFSTPISKAGYYFGRFCGAWLLSTLVMLGIYLGFIIGSTVGPMINWIGPERIGPTPWIAFIKSYLIFVVPNMFFAGALIFALATKFKSSIISFVGTLFIIIGYIVSLNLASDIENQSLAAMLDVFGIRTHSIATQYYTPFEMNTINPSLSGLVLKNRLLWGFIGLIILIVSYFTFSFSTKNKRVKKQKKEKSSSSTISFAKPKLSTIGATDSFWSNFISFFKINFLSMIKSNVYIILLLFAIILLISNLWGGFEYFGLQSYPVTYKMMDVIGGISGIFILIILVFFSGELVWRDRDSHINEVIDGTPHLSIASLFAKTLSLIAIACSVHLFLILIGIIFQAISGYTNFEFGVYLKDFLSSGFVRYIIWSAFLIFIQVIINQKYIGYFVSILFMFMLDFLFIILKVESNMLMLGSTPSNRYSDMNGFGPAVGGKLWFSAYWILFGVLLLIIAGLFWSRGVNSSIKDRFLVGKKSLGKSYFAALTFFGIAWLALAGFLFYNTQILNPYETSHEIELAQVDYEKKFKKYENTPIPSITDVIYYIDIFPKERGLNVKCDLSLINKSDQAIDSLHFTMNKDLKQAVSIPNTQLVFNEDEEYLIYKLSTPLMPGEKLQMVSTAEYFAKGFENDVSQMSILKNGTFFNNFDILPGFGYQKRYEIGDKNLRKKYELPLRDRMPELQSTCNHLCMKNYLTDGAADWVNAETFISTSEDQIAIAPGSLISEMVENGRKKYHYKVDHPSQNFFSFISANYEVARKKWNGIDIEVYYHHAHSVNVEMMLEAIQKSLKYYTENFGPYYHKQARIIEFPRYSTFAQAFPGTMPYSESFGFITNLEDTTKNNVIDAVIAHEMAHQYWAHQVIGADMQGSTMLSESFAEYSSLMVMKQENSPVQMKDFLKYDLQRYLRGRSRESEKELPLYKVENQGHIHYGKGAVILFALQEYIGEDKVNTALKNFLDAYKYQEPPYPTSQDFMRYLKPQIPDSLQYLIKDWFEQITLYDLRMAEANYTKTNDGKYDVKVELIAKKTKADSAGAVEEIPIADWVDVGFYKDRDEKELFFRKRIYIDTENTNLQFTLDTIPAKAAVDPLRILIDRVSDDNRKAVTAGGD